MKLRHPILWLVATILSAQTLWSEPMLATSDIVKANNAFAFDLYKNLAKEPGNLVVSPFSIDTALAMTYAGARGNTARQMARVLHLPAGDTNIHVEFSALLKDLKDTNKLGCQLVTANALWAQQGYPVLKSFQKLLQTQYGTTLKQTDLNGHSAQARREINSWVASQTHDKIKGILQQELPDANTLLILANAIWFKGLWKTPFDKTQTKDLPFQLNSRESVSIPMMHLMHYFEYADTTTLQVLELPYVSNQLSMVILLPKRNDGLPEIEEPLIAAQIEQLHRTSHLTEISVWLPRFKAESGFSLTEPLKSLGMKDAFVSGVADLSGISTNKSLFIQDVLHKAFLDVDETGTEAAAATTVLGTQGIATPFSANHPFLFLIRHNPTGAILFLGRVANPLSNGQ
jgi:serpin B